MFKSPSIQMRRFLPFLILITCFLLPQELYSQRTPTATVRGQVLDDSTRVPLPLTNVFIAGTTIGVSANKEGRFELKGVSFGSQQVVASIIGYIPQTREVRIVGTTEYEIVFPLKPRAIQMPPLEVEAKDPAEWRMHLERFLKEFFGSTPNASKCIILNPQILDFALNRETEEFTATAREALKIENWALGYRIQCVLMLFSVTPRSFQYVGYMQFEPLQLRDSTVNERWRINRQNSYYGSKRHFLTSLVSKKTEDDGFQVSNVGEDWSSSAFRSPAGYKVDPDTLLHPGDSPFERKLTFFPDGLQILYSRKYDWHISLIKLAGPSAIVYLNGLSPLGIQTLGYWSLQRVAELLPSDYEPE